jgi:hypothetical protein
MATTDAGGDVAVVNLQRHESQEVVAMFATGTSFGRLTLGTHHYTHLRDRVEGTSSGYHAGSIATRRREAMSHGVGIEMGACQRHDARHAKRLAHL